MTIELLGQRIFFQIWLILFIPSIEAHNFSCLRRCGSRNPVNYPFGFSEGCKIKLNCSEEGDIKIGEFQVRNITEESILINIPTNCSRPIETIRELFNSNHFFPTSQNSLLLQKCNSSLGGCLIQPSQLGKRFNLLGCNSDSKNENISCYSSDQNNSMFLGFESLNRTGCRFLFSSVVVDEAAVTLDLQTLQLGWWLSGQCGGQCHPNANCTHFQTSNDSFGFRCQCKEGFQGDGFIDGRGCQKISGCDASKYVPGQCEETVGVGLLIGGIIAGASAMAGLAAICYFIRKRSRSSKSRLSAKRLLCEAAGDASIPFYPYKEIERATDSFSEKHRLGTGAYGTVYAGKLHDTEWVAIKKIRNRDTDSIEQVMNEIKLLSSVSHPNLVRLLGCCIEEGEQILVYEFMPNGTLSQHLQRERGNGLPWTTRLNIAAETSRAIAHLHSAVNPPIYHRDIKSSNILLDYNYKSKVADFGLSRVGMMESSHISTAPQGTPGYLDPQYHQNFHLSDKSDVYSFGVVLIEIITALKVVDFSRPHSEVNLAALAIDRIGKGCVDEIIDPFLEPHRDAWTLSSIHKVAELAFRCLAFHKDMRPSMREVADELEHIRLSGWAPLDENICLASSVGSVCSSPCGESEKSFGRLSAKKASIGSRRVIVPKWVTDSLSQMEEDVKENSPVSVQDPWLSEQSSPSTNSLLGNVVP